MSIRILSFMYFIFFCESRCNRIGVINNYEVTDKAEKIRIKHEAHSKE